MSCAKQPDINHAGTVAVDREYHWRKIDADTPRGVKLQVINRAAGVATYSSVGSHSDWTHWAPLPTFAKDDPQ